MMVKQASLAAELESLLGRDAVLTDPSTFADAWRVVEKFGLAARLPAPVKAHLEAGLRGEALDTPKPGDPLFYDGVRDQICVGGPFMGP